MGTEGGLGAGGATTTDVVAACDGAETITELGTDAAVGGGGAE